MTTMVTRLDRAPGIADPGRVPDAGGQRPDPEVSRRLEVITGFVILSEVWPLCCHTQSKDLHFGGASLAPTILGPTSPVYPGSFELIAQTHSVLPLRICSPGG